MHSVSSVISRGNSVWRRQLRRDGKLESALAAQCLEQNAAEAQIAMDDDKDGHDDGDDDDGDDDGDDDDGDDDGNGGHAAAVAHRQNVFDAISGVACRWRERAWCTWRLKDVFEWWQRRHTGGPRRESGY